MTVTVRQMRASDVERVHKLSDAAFTPLEQANPRPVTAREDVQRARGEGRLRHLLASDPDGMFVAEDGRDLVGVACAMVRDRALWLLSLLAVDPARQSEGIGHRLLQSALAYGAGSGARLVVSSSDPRALRAYHHAGLSISPTLEAHGRLERRSIPTALRSSAGDPGRHGELIAACARFVRGAAYDGDIEAALSLGCRLLVCGDDGFALARDGSPYVLAARSAAAATDLCWSCLATAEPGAEVALVSILPGNDWALSIALDAGLRLRVNDAVFHSGVTAPLAPFLPSGAFL